MEKQCPAALGLNKESSNQEIKEKVFQYAVEIGTLEIASISADGVTPTIRAVEVHYLDDDGNLYITMSHGKPMYKELKKNPRISCGTIQFTQGKLGVSIRINADLEEVYDKAIFDRYWKQNPGTRRLYSKDLNNYAIFRLAKGDGELFDLCEDDKILRLRFGFGGTEPRSWHYAISENCVGCGTCVETCMMSVIQLEDGKAVIDYSGCLECGRCHETCPCGAVEVHKA